MRSRGLGLASLESGRPARDFDLIGFSLPHELAASNVLTLLDLAGLPLLARERGEGDSIVVAGGPAVFNPEPLADFLDAVFLGDGEEGAAEMLRLIGQARREGLARSEILKRLAQLKGVYVPAFYEPVYEAGRFAGLKVIGPGPKRIGR
ncbi:MAG: B12-binding domain-containing radical SAM protein, partial [Deltaproteobacteria bacterium]|nr:B12-binding domain-containing radical SAM protein [Deltaproteobacteria bacterium]